VSEEKANMFKVQYLHGRCGRKCARQKGDSGCAIPWEMCRSSMSYHRRGEMGEDGRSQR
jgi:hypothetical protein